MRNNRQFTHSIRHTRFIVFIGVLALILTACKSTGPRQLTVMTHDSFAVSEAVVKAFENANDAKVTFLLIGDAGTALNKAILSKDNPMADVFYGVDNTFLSRALEEGIFEAYDAPLLAKIPQAFKLDPSNRALPVDYGDVCLNYDKAYLADKGISPPSGLEDLLEPVYKGLLVVENPATSSPGLAFLLATIGHFGEQKYLDFWKGLVDNQVLVANNWNTAYYTEFTRAGGTRPIVVSYGSSPVFELIYAQVPAETTPVDGVQQSLEPPTEAVVSDGSCFRQVEFAGVLKGAPHIELARKWLDFMLSTTFQEDMPLQMYVFPVNPDAKLDETFSLYLASPAKPAFVSPQEIAAKREQWLQAWTDTVLR